MIVIAKRTVETHTFCFVSLVMKGAPPKIDGPRSDRGKSDCNHCPPSLTDRQSVRPPAGNRLDWIAQAGVSSSNNGAKSQRLVTNRKIQTRLTPAGPRERERVRNILTCSYNFILIYFPFAPGDLRRVIYHTPSVVPSPSPRRKRSPWGPFFGLVWDSEQAESAAGWLERTQWPGIRFGR